MFYDEINDESKIWKFYLIDGTTIIGQVNDHTNSTNGTPIMIQIIDGAVIGYTTDIPWNAIVKVHPLAQKAIRRV